MKKIILPIFLFSSLSSSCLEDPLHVERCGNSCAVDSNGNFLIGVDAEAYADEIYNCGLGTLTCYNSAEVCEGWRVSHHDDCSHPIIKECDGYPLDTTFGVENYLNDCNDFKTGVCAYTKKVCFSDGWHCSLPEYYGDEFCDGLDNNCSGEVDEEDLLVYTRPLFKYDYPIETVNNGICQAGVVRCVDGHEIYVGEQGPETEICGTQIDEDCDGFVDETELDLNAAFYLSVDFSDSMSYQIEALISAICQWSDDDQFARSRFAIDAVAIDNTGIGYRRKITDFTDAVSACIELREFYTSDMPVVGSEFVAYSMMQSFRDEYHWPENLDKNIIMFTDEPYQGDPRNTISDDISLINMCNSNPDVELGFFINTSYLSSWQSMIDGCGVWVQDLGYDTQSTLYALNKRFRGEC